MKVYKVCRRMAGRNVSSLANWPGLEREYNIGQTTLPYEGTYLYAFITLRDARRFCIFNGRAIRSGVIFECEADVVYEGKPTVSFGARELSDVLTWWRNGAKSTSTMLNEPPEGTVWCRSIMPTSEIWRNK